MSKHNPIIVALDNPSENKALRLVSELRDRVWGFKVGSILFTAAGPGVVRRILALRGRVFLDLKFHDIPHTVEGACAEAVRLGVHMLNVHTGGGLEMMKAAAKAVRETAKQEHAERPILLGVTVLTSLDARALPAVGLREKPAALVRRRALLARKAGLHGVVASPEEGKALKRACGKSFVVVTPGVRPAGASHDDQKRTLTPAEAMKAGSDYLVIGRPITGAPSPSRALDAILAEL